MAQEDQRTRITVDISNNLSESLDQIARETGRNKSEVLRQAISLMVYAQQAKDDGMKVGGWVEDDDAKIRREREFIGL